MLRKFKVSSSRDLLAPDFECYQMDLSGPVNDAIEAGEISDEEFKFLPSWTKFGANPLKAKGFFTRMLEAVFLGQGGHDELNVDYQVEEIPNQRVAMMFISTKNNVSLNTTAKIAQQTLPGFEVIALNGSAYYNGTKISNKNAEGAVKDIVAKGRPVLILSRDMASRSFSIPEITELYLAYDRGSEGTTIQKMSRTLTPGDKNKIGRIFSLSFDPNRDDKFDAMIVETALNYKKRHDSKSLQESMREVLKTIDIFRCSPDGAVKINIDTYLDAALERKGISRVLGKKADITLLSPEDISALANGNSDYFRNQKQDKTQTGDTKDSEGNSGSDSDSDSDPNFKPETELAKAREVIVTILENIDIIILGTNNTILVEAMSTIKEDEEMSNCIQEEFGVTPETIGYLFEKGIIKQDWVELLHDA